METTVSGRRLILRSIQSPGDLVMQRAAVHDLHAAAPGRFLTDLRKPLADQLANNLLAGIVRQLTRAQRLLVSDDANGVCTPCLPTKVMASVRHARRGSPGPAGARGLKGPGRPIIAEHDRAQLLAALACVQHVLIFDDATPHELLHRIRPDVLVKGGSTSHVVGREVVEAYVGQVVVTGLIPGASTTSLVERTHQSIRSNVICAVDGRRCCQSTAAICSDAARRDVTDPETKRPA